MNNIIFSSLIDKILNLFKEIADKHKTIPIMFDSSMPSNYFYNKLKSIFSYYLREDLIDQYICEFCSNLAKGIKDNNNKFISDTFEIAQEQRSGMYILRKL